MFQERWLCGQLPQPPATAPEPHILFFCACLSVSGAPVSRSMNETRAALLVRGQRDGEGVWGRWNANGPGTARLFHELDLGRNFTDYALARPGDFMKIFWTSEVGRAERGHSVVYIGRELVGGTERVRFWSSNKPAGYGEKSVPRTEDRPRDIFTARPAAEPGTRPCAATAGPVSGQPADGALFVCRSMREERLRIAIVTFASRFEALRPPPTCPERPFRSG